MNKELLTKVVEKRMSELKIDVYVRAWLFMETEVALRQGHLKSLAKLWCMKIGNSHHLSLSEVKEMVRAYLTTIYSTYNESELVSMVERAA